MRTIHQPASEPCLTNDYSGLCADCPDKDGCEPAKDGLGSISESQNQKG